MVMQKRWFIRPETDVKEFARIIRHCKQLTPEFQQVLLRSIFEIGLDRMMCTGVKRKRIRKKMIKQEMQRYKEELTYRFLDMMVEEYRDVPEMTKEQQHEAFTAITELE